jgi:hypothetical protein
LGWRLLKTGETVKDRWPWAGAGRAYIVAKTLGVLILGAGYAFQVIQQDVNRVVLTFGLPTLAILWANMFWGLRDKWLLREADDRSSGSLDPSGVSISES